MNITSDTVPERMKIEVLEQLILKSGLDVERILGVVVKAYNLGMEDGTKIALDKIKEVFGDVSKNHDTS